jgi:hypothetical protein
MDRGAPENVTFEFVTDGTIGPSARTLITQLESDEELLPEIADLQDYRNNIRIVRDAASASTLFDSSVQLLIGLLPFRGMGSELLEAARKSALDLHYLALAFGTMRR